MTALPSSRKGYGSIPASDVRIWFVQGLSGFIILQLRVSRLIAKQHYLHYHIHKCGGKSSVTWTKSMIWVSSKCLSLYFLRFSPQQACWSDSRTCVRHCSDSQYPTHLIIFGRPISQNTQLKTISSFASRILVHSLGQRSISIHSLSNRLAWRSMNVPSLSMTCCPDYQESDETSEFLPSRLIEPHWI